MDACSVTALGIKQILMQSCGISDAINVVQTLADITSHVASSPPALLIMDICGENELMLDGLRLLAHLRETHPTMKMVICTDFSDYRVLELLVSSKAHGILLKHEPALALTQCVTRGILRSRQWLSPRVQQLLAKTPLKIPRLPPESWRCSPVYSPDKAFPELRRRCIAIFAPSVPTSVMP
jgi:two-component system capsular synthesis response regulator RcsB